MARGRRGMRNSKGFGSAQGAATLVLVLCAVAISVSAVKQAFITPETPAVNPGFSATFAESIHLDSADWQAIKESALMVGHRSAPVEVAQFIDLECPFCQRFHSAIRSLRDELGDDLVYYVVHSPIPTIHPHALPGARAAECADAQGRLWEFLDAVFSEHSSIGVRSWVSFAEHAGVKDLGTFDSCATGDGPVPRVDRGLELGNRVGIRGTPSVVINGWLVRPTPYDNLPEVVDSIRYERGHFAPSN